MGGALLYPLTLLSMRSPEPLCLTPLHPCSLVSDGTVAIFVGMIMFIMPSKIPGLTQDPGKYMDWSKKKPPGRPCFLVA